MDKVKRKKSYRFGIAAEKACSWYLRAKGYRILAERYRNSHGEIDILAMRGETLVAVEVKARKDFRQCAEAVPPMKRMRIARAAEGALASGQIAGLARARSPSIRFDVIGIVPWRWPRHWKDAWRM